MEIPEGVEILTELDRVVAAVVAPAKIEEVVEEGEEVVEGEEIAKEEEKAETKEENLSSAHKKE